MAIKITQPFSFDSRQPNFERDVINANGFNILNPLFLTSSEETAISQRYDVGHIVWDTVTLRDYRVEFYNQHYHLVPLDYLAMTSNQWYQLKDGNNNYYIPKAGEVVIFTDYRTEIIGNDTIYHPSFKVGDGVTDVINLPYMDAEYATTSGTAEKVAHKLYIGNHEYDGSATVSINVYVDSDLEVDSDDWSVNP